MLGRSFGGINLFLGIKYRLSGRILYSCRRVLVFSMLDSSPTAHLGLSSIRKDKLDKLEISNPSQEIYNSEENLQTMAQKISKSSKASFPSLLNSTNSRI